MMRKEVTPEQRERKLLMARLYKARHREEIREYNKKYKAENYDALREKTNEYRRANPDKVRKWLKTANLDPVKAKERQRRYLESHTEQRQNTIRRYEEANREKKSERHKVWRKNNPEKAKANVNARRRRLRDARPFWANRKAIRVMYLEAARTGLTVDHIVPLEHPIVCGLHVPANLQLLPMVENISKGNRFEIIYTTNRHNDA